MKILFIQKVPCIRNWKMAMVLNEIGHEVYLGQMTNALESHWTLPTDCYKEKFTLSSVVGLSMIAPYFDIIHVHNEPDWWTSFALAVTKDTKIPVIHDCHDWVPGRQHVEIESLATSIVANTLSDLAIYVSEVQQEIVATSVGEFQSKHIIIHNYPLRSCIPEEPMPKLRKEGGKINLVYAGGMSDHPQSHRYFLQEFTALLKAGYEIYAYAPSVPDGYHNLDRSFRNFHVKGHCAYPNLMKEISQYDIGLLPFQKNMHNADHLDSGLPNKLFEYISAGLPVACKAGLQNQEEFIAKNQVGFMYHSVDDFRFAAMAALGIKPDRFKWVFDDEVTEILLPHYMTLSANNTYAKIDLTEPMKFKDYAVECEIFEGYDLEVGLYGCGHEKDLAFESYMASERKIVNEEAQDENAEEVGTEAGE